jgi:hypothetical protein
VSPGFREGYSDPVSNKTPAVLLKAGKSLVDDKGKTLSM